MGTVILVALICALCIFFLGKRKKRTEHRRAPSAFKRPEKSFVERHGELPCDGTACSVNDTCSEAERLFCRDVLSQALPGGFYSSQYMVCLPSGVRKIDFAFRSPDNRKIAIEMDGYGPHVANLTREKFDEQLIRQNELILDGWQVLRFSFDQCVNQAADCVAAIRSLVGADTRVKAFPAIFYDVFYPYEKGHQPARAMLKKAGAMYSERRDRWYFHARQEPKVPLPEGWKLTIWAECPMCGGKSHLSGVQWQCKACSARFETPNVI